MRVFATSIVLLALTAPATALEQLTDITPLLSYPSLSFQRDSGWQVDNRPVGALYPADYIIGTGKTAGMAGSEALAIAARSGASEAGSGGVMRTIPVEDSWRGKRIRLSARLKSRDVERLQIWVSADHPNRRKNYTAMSGRNIVGTTDWRRDEIVIHVPTNSTSLSYGFVVTGGKGEAWADSFKVEAAANAP